MPTGQRATMPTRRRRGMGACATRVVYPPRARVDPVRPARRRGRERVMVVALIRRTGLRAGHLHAVSLASVGLCIGLWIRAKTVDQDERGNAERRALFVGLWPPTLWLIGDSLDR